jgi:hypothetical protein
MRDGEVLALQRCLVALALAPEAGEPAALAAAHGLPERDQAAFRAHRNRLLYYRGAMRDDLREPLDQDFPLLRFLLEQAGAWQDCQSAFLATRSLQSPFYRDISPTFLGWLASSAWGQDRWPFLLELAHFELVKELVEHVPDGEPPAGLHAVPSLQDRLVLAPPTQVLTYTYRVFEATWEHPEPPPGLCHLLASRDGDGYIQWRVLTEAAACLLVAAKDASVGEAARALGLTDTPELLAFLEDLKGKGALLGFRDG